MPRPSNPIPSVQMLVRVPQDLWARLTAYLFSELEGRIPYGKQGEFVCERIREFFSLKQLDLAPYTGLEPGLFVVSGDAMSIEILRNKLEKQG